MQFIVNENRIYQSIKRHFSSHTGIRHGFKYITVLATHFWNYFGFIKLSSFWPEIFANCENISDTSFIVASMTGLLGMLGQ
jgi:hypothetical protein